MRSVFVCGVSAILLAGCASDPRSYETVPVKVETSKGIVTCQLYSPEILVWDRAIDRPRTMDVIEADEICQEEGRRQLQRFNDGRQAS